MDGEGLIVSFSDDCCIMWVEIGDCVTAASVWEVFVMLRYELWNL